MAIAKLHCWVLTGCSSYQVKQILLGNKVSFGNSPVFRDMATRLYLAVFFDSHSNLSLLFKTTKYLLDTYTYFNISKRRLILCSRHFPSCTLTSLASVLSQRDQSAAADTISCNLYAFPPGLRRLSISSSSLKWDSLNNTPRL